jgi:dTDP-4-amino-4,6-dideoxygalactose transaminase
MANCKRHRLYQIGDCDALGSPYHDKLTGTLGNLETAGFYPLRHITMVA